MSLKYVFDHVNTDILADEAVFSPYDALQIVSHRAANLINIKLAKSGGIYQAEKMPDEFKDKISDDDKRELKIDRGLRIVKLGSGKLRSAGVKEGFIITSIDKRPIITIEDIIEEIVGEIADEYDDDEKPIEWISENSARVAANLNIEDFANELEVKIPDNEIEDVDSVGGFVAKTLGRVAIPGSTVSIPGWKLIAERPVGRRHRIATFLVERTGEVSSEEALQ